MKEIIWKGPTLKDICSFPQHIRKEIGFELYNIQLGNEPSDWKAMSSIGSGVKEIRIHDNNEYRVIYVASFEEAIYVLHTFVKKSQKTLKRDIDQAKQRYIEVVKLRTQR